MILAAPASCQGKDERRIGLDYLIVSLSALIAALLTLFSGFGLGTLLLPAFALFFPMEIAVAAVAVVHLANNLFKLLLVGRFADPRAALAFGLPALGASACGALLLGFLSSLRVLAEYSLGGRAFQLRPVDFVIGLLMCAFAFLEFLPIFSKLAFKRSLLPVGGVLSGFFGGLSGHQGGFRSAFLIKSGLSREAFLGTGVVCAVMVDLPRLLVYGLDLFGKHFSTFLEGKLGSLVLSGIIAAFAGSYLGAKFFRKVTLLTVQRIVVVMVLVMGLAIAAGLLSKAT